jgi:vacuolar-type H+-ATPase subunit H
MRGDAVSDQTDSAVSGSADANAEQDSPLQAIHDKELEMSGQLLQAKREADEIVADARRLAAEIVGEVEASGGSGSADVGAAIRATGEADAERIREETGRTVKELTERIDARHEDAVRLVVEAVTTVEPR